MSKRKSAETQATYLERRKQRLEIRFRQSHVDFDDDTTDITSVINSFSAVVLEAYIRVKLGSPRNTVAKICID